MIGGDVVAGLDPPRFASLVKKNLDTFGIKAEVKEAGLILIIETPLNGDLRAPIESQSCCCSIVKCLYGLS